jgi:hypothetical protein
MWLNLLTIILLQVLKDKVEGSEDFNIAKRLLSVISDAKKDIDEIDQKQEFTPEDIAKETELRNQAFDRAKQKMEEIKAKDANK